MDDEELIIKEEPIIFKEEPQDDPLQLDNHSMGSPSLIDEPDVSIVNILDFPQPIELQTNFALNSTPRIKEEPDIVILDSLPPPTVKEEPDEADKDEVTVTATAVQAAVDDDMSQTTVKEEPDIENIQIQFDEMDEEWAPPAMGKRKTTEMTSFEEDQELAQEVKRPKKSPRYCNVYGCLVNSVTCPNYAIFPLPKDKFRRSDWLKLIDREDLIDRTDLNCYVCEKHFQEGIDLVTTTKRKLLAKNAFPSVLLPSPKSPLEMDLTQHVNATVHSSSAMTTAVAQPQAPMFIYVTENVIPIGHSSNEMQIKVCKVAHNYTQTDVVVTKDAAIEVQFQGFEEYKKIIHDTLVETKKRIKAIEKAPEKTKKEDFHLACDKYLSPHLAELIKGHTDLTWNGRGNRYSTAHKIFALNLYFVNKKVYRMMEEQFCLPGFNRLRYIHMPVTTNFSDDVAAALTIKVKNMSECEKQCAVAVDVIELKGNVFYNCRQDKLIGLHDVDGKQKMVPAQYALAVLVRGLFVDWVQPIGFTFLSKTKTPVEVSKWIDKVLEKLIETGLKIHAYIPNITSDLLDEANIRNITVERPIFVIKNVQINFIFNVPDLMTQLRNTFLTHDFEYSRVDGGKVTAKSDHIRMFYEQDKARRLRLAPKVSEEHVRALGPARRSLRHAAQLFSRSLATALAVYTDYCALDDTARYTVEVLLLINDMFDLLYSSTIAKNTYKTAFTGDRDQLNVLNRAVDVLGSLKVSHIRTGQDPTPYVNLDFITQFPVTIASIIRIMQTTKNVEGCKHLFTKYLSLDVTNKFFNSIRSKGDMDVLPTANQFVTAYRRLFFSHMLKPPKGGTCSSMDLTRHLIRLTNFADPDEPIPSSSKSKIPSKDVASNDYMKDDKLNTVSYKDIKPAKTTSVREVCSVLLKICLGVKKHKKCEAFKAFKVMFDSGEKDDEPRVKRIVEFVKEMEKVFQEVMAGVGSEELRLAGSAYGRASAAGFAPPCKCFPTEYFMKSFFRLRINMTQNYNNMVYRKNRYKASKFVIPKLTE